MPIIEVKNIGKKYNISHRQGGYLTLRDVLTNVFRNPFRFLRQKVKAAAGLAKNEDFWALKDVSFSVEKGEVIGIIGHNGAGKSTLLKILSQITPPTTGEININGRVGSLLEVGTGFHPELTGRENIFLNGAILGMERDQIVKKFDEIVAFSGVEKFLDTPVKYYSSGMYVRLAFSVAAHMEPDVLIIDEVLAVGDSEFQEKCLGKMDEITRKEGRTILFVSHNLGAIKQLCSRCVVLREGKIGFIGKTEDALSFYTVEELDQKTEWVGQEGDESAILKKAWVKSLDEHGEFNTTSDVEIGMEIQVLEPMNDFVAGIILFSEFGNELARVNYDDNQLPPTPVVNPGNLKIKFVIPKNSLAQGRYRVQFEIGILRCKVIVGINSSASLIFSLRNVNGLGSRSTTNDNLRYHSSLFRPNWSK